MCYRGVSALILAACLACSAVAADVIDVPGAQAVQAAVKSPSARDQNARTAATAAILVSVVYAQAGDRAKAKTFTPQESARIAELQKLADTVEQSNEASLPAACRGRDCEERYAYNRCYSAYRFGPSFYRAVFDRFFTPAQQQAIAPSLADAGSMWHDGLAMPPQSHPFDQFQAPSGECTKTTFGSSLQTAAGAPAGSRAAPQPPSSDTPTIPYSAHADALRRAKAAGVDTTILGLTLGEPVQLPLCPERSLFTVIYDPPATCIDNDHRLDGVADLLNGLIPQGGPTEVPIVTFSTGIVMPSAKCPGWLLGCMFAVAVVDGRVVGASINTDGLKSQHDVASALEQKYKAATSSFLKEWSNDAGNKLNAREMAWALPGLTVEFKGYTGGSSDAPGTLLIETDVITSARSALDKAKQAAKQKL